MLLDKDSRYTLIAVSVTSFLTPFTGSAVNLAIPAIGKDLGADVVMLTWMATSFLLASAAFLLPIGRMADIKGRKRLFIIGVTIFGTASLLAGFCSSAHLLIAMRVLQGIGGAFVFSTGMAMLTSVTPPQMRGRVLGINAAVVYVGVSVGPALGGFITHNLSWRFIFYISFVLAVIAVFAATRVRKDIPSVKGQNFNAVGALLYTLGLVAAMYGLSIITSVAWGKWLFIAGILTLTLFVHHELSSDSPLIELRLLLKNRPFAFSNLAALINYMATTGISFLLSVYLQVVKGLNAQTAGLILLSQPVIMAVISPYSGRLSDRVEPQIVATWGMALTLVGLIMFQFLSSQTPLGYIMLTLVIMGFGFGLFAPPNNNAVMSSVAARDYGVASSTISTMRLVGQTLSMTLVTLIIAAVMGQVHVSPQHAALFLVSMKIALGGFAISCIGGIFASLARGSVRPELDNL